MAFTQTDIDNAKAAINTIIARGSAEVEINGRRVRYLSLSDLMNAITAMEQDLISNTHGTTIPIAFTPVSD